MKKLLFLPFLAVILIFFLNPNTQSFLANKLSYSLCDQPIKYKIDTVDPKFNLSRQEFTSDVDQATQIWEQPVGKDLFVDDPKGELSINLIFDERQSLTNQINQLENQVQENKQNLTPQINEYKKESADFETKLENFKKEVNDWNSKGGAPEDVYNRLIQEQRNLQKEADRLNQLAKSLNLSSQDYNSQVTQLNQTIRTFNADLAQRPEEGIFKGPENRIEIYFNISHSELIHTLAHELGHALGLSHIQPPKSIMYGKTNQMLILSPDDLVALEEVCKRHNYFEILQVLFQRLTTHQSSWGML